MIVGLRKFLIYGRKGEVDRFFPLAQQAGFLEFIGLSYKRALEMPEEGKKFLLAIKIAKQHIVYKALAPDLDPLPLAERILALHEKSALLLEEEKKLVAEKERVAIFGNFSLEDIREIEKSGKRAIQFFCAGSETVRDLDLPFELFFLGSAYDLDYFVAINPNPVHHSKLAEIVIEETIGEVRTRLAALRAEKTRVDAQLRLHCNGLAILEHGFAHSLNEYQLGLAKNDASSLLAGELFAIEAWVPVNRLSDLEKLVQDLDVEYLEVAIEPKDRIPTCIENRGIGRVAEDLIHVYDVPSPTDKDPSLWVLSFFSIFFAMILGDAGYGLLFLIATLFLRKKYAAKAPPAVRRFFKLSLILSTATIIWGTLTASFFGIELTPSNPLRAYSLPSFLAEKKADYHLALRDSVYREYVKSFPSVATATSGADFLAKTAYHKGDEIRYKALEDFTLNTLLELSLLLGIVHLSLSLIRNARRNFAALGWVFFLVGGYLYMPTYLHITSMGNYLHLVSPLWSAKWGLWILLSGPLLVLLLALCQGQRWMALHELTNGIQVFSDVLSYLRLYALALAGLVMAQTMNDTLGIKLGFLGTFLVIVMGHGLNIVISVMSATIHGLRLNFLEWYRYSFEGGGRLFRPLQLHKK
ncbi:MAG: V-type ATP synthase subunit I [Verrucomicrobiota bacterium]|nr:V-type ATP synthase subunit I [Verrucomicrobiota bacterium]